MPIFIDGNEFNTSSEVDLLSALRKNPGAIKTQHGHYAEVNPTIVTLKPREAIFVHHECKSNLGSYLERVFAPDFSTCVLLVVQSDKETYIAHIDNGAKVDFNKIYHLFDKASSLGVKIYHLDFNQIKEVTYNFYVNESGDKITKLNLEILIKENDKVLQNIMSALVVFHKANQNVPININLFRHICNDARSTKNFVLSLRAGDVVIETNNRVLLEGMYYPPAAVHKVLEASNFSQLYVFNAHICYMLFLSVLDGNVRLIYNNKTGDYLKENIINHNNMEVNRLLSIKQFNELKIELVRLNNILCGDNFLPISFFDQLKDAFERFNEAALYVRQNSIIPKWLNEKQSNNTAATTLVRHTMVRVGLNGQQSGNTSYSSVFVQPLRHDSPIKNHENQQLKDDLRVIVPNKDWQFQTNGQIYLRLADEEEAKRIVNHFKDNGYNPKDVYYDKDNNNLGSYVVFLQNASSGNLTPIPRLTNHPIKIEGQEDAPKPP